MTESTQPDGRAEAKIDRLDRVLLGTRAGMALEAFLRAFWALGSLLAVMWAALAFGLAEIANRKQLMVMLGLGALLALLLLVRGVRRFRWPTRAAARARVDATLPGRPLAAMRDRPALNASDPAARAVWAAHLARMRRLAAAARTVAPDLRLSRYDPWAVRLVALVALIAAVIFAGSEGLRGVPAALAPHGGAAVATGPSYEGWAEPPAYTGRPTLYLPQVSADAPVSVPVGTKVTLRAYGKPERFALAESVSDGPTAALTEAAPGISTVVFSVAHDGAVALRERGSGLGAWTFAVEPDLAPTIQLTQPVGRASGGKTQIAYAAHDDHGVTAARVEIALDLPRVDRRYGLAVAPVARPPLVADLPLPMKGNARAVTETLVEDFSQSPWAGLPVTVTLIARDALDQEGRSAPQPAVLPGRRFYDPAAAALVEQRRDLLWSPENARRVVQVLRAVTYHPEGLFDNQRAYLIVRVAIRELARATEAGDPGPAIEPVAAALWRAALLLEDGGIGDAAARLAKARERLSQALKNGASDDEIAQLMDELRQATSDYMQQMAEQALKRGDSQRADVPPGQMMTQDQIQQLMDRIQQLSEQGRKAEADAVLKMLQDLLDNMQMMMTEGGQGGGPGEPGQKSLQGLSDALREQQGLADDSFRQLQREFRQAPPDGQGEGQDQGEGGKGQPGADGQEQLPDVGALADRQEALRRLMEQMQRGLPGGTGDTARQALRDAERNMGDARDGLREGDTAGALDHQSEAIDALRNGLTEMSKDLRQAEQGQGQPIRDGRQQADAGRDPLGRPLGARGGIGTDQSMLPEADSAARARGIFDEIRRRTGEQMRPAPELDYLRRLLDLF